MKKLSFIAVALMMLSIQANAVVVSLDGEEADGAALNILELNNTNTDEVLDISFSFFYEALDPSWATDLVVEIAHLDSDTFFQIGTQDFGCADFGVECEFDLGWLDEPGVFEAAGTISLAPSTILDGSGDWEVVIADSFDDFGADGVFLSGSFVDISQGTRPVPATSPSALLLIVFVALSLLSRRQLI